MPTTQPFCRNSAGLAKGRSNGLIDGASTQQFAGLLDGRFPQGERVAADAQMVVNPDAFETASMSAPAEGTTLLGKKTDGRRNGPARLCLLAHAYVAIVQSHLRTRAPTCQLAYGVFEIVEVIVAIAQ